MGGGAVGSSPASLQLPAAEAPSGITSSSVRAGVFAVVGLEEVSLLFCSICLFVYLVSA